MDGARGEPAHFEQALTAMEYRGGRRGRELHGAADRQDGSEIDGSSKVNAHTPDAQPSTPLRIDPVSAGKGMGRIGITLCPGKTDPHGMTGAWKRDLTEDLDAIRDWGARAVVTLVTPREMVDLKVPNLGDGVRSRRMEWWHLPIPDGHAPDEAFEARWVEAGAAIRNHLRSGRDVLVHCKGGLGRAGTMAARLMVELGTPPEDAIRLVRESRCGAIENRKEEAHVGSCRAGELQVQG